MRQANSMRGDEHWKRLLALLVAILLAAFLLRVYGLQQQSFSWDEMKSVDRATSTIPALLANLQEKKQQVPMYYILLRPWVRLGSGEFVVRFFSVLLGTVTIPLLYQVGRLLGGRRTGAVAAALLALSPFHVWYSQEARMYVLVAGSLLLAHWFLFRALRRGRRLHWAGYVAAMVIAVYSHYFAFLVLVAHYVSFALHARHLRRLFLRWLVCAAAVALAFSPWAIFILLSGGYGDAVPPWITPVAWLDPLYTMLSFSAGHTIDPQNPLPYLALAVYVSGLIVALTKMPPARSTDPGQWLPRRQLLLWFAVPLGLVFILSLDWPLLPEAPFSLYVDRYLIVSLPAFTLLAAWGIDEAARRRPALPLRSLAIAIVVLGTIPALINLYFNPLYWRADWRGLVDTLQAEVQTTDALLLADGQFLPLAYYGQSAPSSSKLPPPPPESASPALLQAFEAEMASRVADATVGALRAWQITPVYRTDTHGFVQERNRQVAREGSIAPRQAWMDAHYRRIALWRFTGLQLALYDLSQNPQAN